uniref:Alba domain-containing protein n=1 Tax=Macrostomum lignano TaxID=282301 RepID=A0A1I8F509_9PLAT
MTDEAFGQPQPAGGRPSPGSPSCSAAELQRVAVARHGGSASRRRRPLPDKADDQLQALQRLCIVRSVRPERLLQATAAFAVSVVGSAYTRDPGVEPTAVGSTRHPSAAATRAGRLSGRRLARSSALRLTGRPPIVFQRGAKRAIQRAMAEDAWALLHCSGPATLDVMQRCADLAAGGQLQKQPQAASFRLVMTCRADCAAWAATDRGCCRLRSKSLWTCRPSSKDCVQRCWASIEQQA